MDKKIIFGLLIVLFLFTGCSYTEIEPEEVTTTTTTTTTTTQPPIIYSLCLVDGDYIRVLGDCPE